MRHLAVWLSVSSASLPDRERIRHWNTAAILLSGNTVARRACSADCDWGRSRERASADCLAATGDFGGAETIPNSRSSSAEKSEVQTARWTPLPPCRPLLRLPRRCPRDVTAITSGPPRTASRGRRTLLLARIQEN